MRILFLGLNYTPEQIGIGPYTTGWAEALAAAGHEVTVVAARPYYPAWRVFDGHRGWGWRSSLENGVRVIRCPIYVPVEPNGTRRLIHHVSFALASAPPMLWHALSRRPDLVITIAPSLIAATIALVAAKMVRARSWLHIQDFEMEAAFATGLLDSRGSGARLAKRFERMMLRTFNDVSTISPNMVARLVSKGVPEERTHELRNWAEIDSIVPLDRPSLFRAEWKIKTPHVALYSGNISNKQGIEIIVEAARSLQHRDDLTFLICGNGPNRERLEAVAAGLSNILFQDLQPRERLSELLGLATIHMLPQLAGAADLVLPSKLANMMASGRPIVATAAYGTDIAQEVQGCGLVVIPGDGAAMADVIMRLIDEPGLAGVLGDAGRVRAEMRWSRHVILDQLQALTAGLHRMDASR